MRPEKSMDNPVTLTQLAVAVIGCAVLILTQFSLFVWFLAGLSKDVKSQDKDIQALEKQFEKHCEEKDIHVHASEFRSLKETMERIDDRVEGVDGKIDRLLEAERKTILRPTQST